MYTRCPQCKAVHALSAELLSHARGLVQCGECGRTFSALSFLFDDWPYGEAHGPAEGPNTVPPVLQQAEEPEARDEDKTAEEASQEDGKSRKELVWGLATVLLFVLTMANAAWTFREPLLSIPAVKSLVAGSDETPVEEHGLLKDPGQIQLVSRDMHTHPTRSGILVLSLTFVNLAQRSQVYPELELTLLDAANQPVAKRRLQPADYLRPGADIAAGLATDVYLPVLLELGDPGERAVGFEIQFL
jgi:predicted Zn finger-like uncharacterized protein